MGYVNIIKNAGRRYTGIGQREECEIPDYCMRIPGEATGRSFLKSVAETSDEFMERYFAGEEFSVEEIRAAMRTEVMDGTASYRWLWDPISRRRVLRTSCLIS